MSRVTVVVTPRDRFGGTAECLAALRAGTPEPYDLLVLDLGWPRRVEREVCREVEGRAGAAVVRLGRMLPIEALARVRDRVRTPYAFLLDSDSLVEDGWLDPLVGTIEAGAAIAEIGRAHV